MRSEVPLGFSLHRMSRAGARSGFRNLLGFPPLLAHLLPSNAILSCGMSSLLLPALSQAFYLNTDSLGFLKEAECLNQEQALGQQYQLHSYSSHGSPEVRAFLRDGSA